MTNVTMSILPEIDAAVFVISANSPFSQFEKEFLENKMLTSDLGRIIFAVNCFGTFSKEDEDWIDETDEKRICRKVIEKEKKVIVIRPDNTDGFSRLEKDKEKIKALYHDGYTKGLLFSDKVKEFYTK